MERGASAIKSSKESIQSFIIDELTRFRAEGQIAEDTPLNPETRLYGSQGVLKSRPLVELLLAVEDHVEVTYDKVFDWTSDQAMSLQNSPFRTIETLAAFVAESSTDRPA